MTSFDVIAALDRKRGIGRNGQLPWHIPPDLRYFHDTTLGSAVIMGRKTWDSLPQGPLEGLLEKKTLPDRINVVISSKHDLVLPKDVLLCDSFEKALEVATSSKSERVFVIGGAEIYKLALAQTNCNELFLTHIETEFDCDTFFPDYEEKFEQSFCGETQTYEQLQFAFCRYKRRQ